MLKWILTRALKLMPEAIRRLTGLAARGPRTSQATRPDCASYGNPRPARSRRMHPRRSRCGLSLFEATLVMMIAIPLTQQGVRLAEHYIREQAGVQESRLLTQVVTAASTFALREGLQATIRDRVGVGRIQLLTLANLALRNAWLSTNSRTALGRDIQVILHAHGSNELVVLARAVTPAGENTRAYVPRGGIGIGLVGYVPADAPTMLRGPGLNYNLSALQAQAISQGQSPPVVGDQIAIAVLRMDQDVLPFLHREPVDGRPELNRMQTDLDMGGFDLVGAAQLQADMITVTDAMEISQLRGKLEVEGDIASGGDLTIPGNLTSAQATIDGRINAGGLEVTGPAQFGSVEARSIQVTGAVRVTRDVTVNRQVTTTTLAADKVVVGGVLAARSATIGTVQAGQVRSTLINSAQLVAEKIITGSCTGC